MTRQQTNIDILRLLRVLIDKYPHQRFGQLLSNYVIPPNEDIFYLEGGYFIDKLNENIYSKL